MSGSSRYRPGARGRVPARSTGRAPASRYGALKRRRSEPGLALRGGGARGRGRGRRAGRGPAGDTCARGGGLWGRSNDRGGGRVRPGRGRFSGPSPAATRPATAGERRFARPPAEGPEVGEGR